METPSAILGRLIQEMSDDNDGPFQATPMQRARAERAIQQMLDDGWNPKKLTPGFNEDYGKDGDDVFVLACGEQSDQENVVDRYRGGSALWEVLVAIFDHEGDD